MTLGGSVVGLAGCISDSPATSSPNGRNTPRSDEGINVAFEAVQPTIVELQTDTLSLSTSNHQYLYIQVDSTGNENPRPESFALWFDGSKYQPIDRHNIYRNRVDVQYSRSTGEGWLLYELPPTGYADDARIVQGGSKWTPPSTIRELLRTEPTSFTVSVSFPETIPQGQKPTVSLTVTNNHDRPGWFVAGLSRSGPSIARIPAARLSKPVGATETANFTVTDNAPMDTVTRDERNDGKPDMRYYLEWESGTAEGAVRITD